MRLSNTFELLCNTNIGVSIAKTKMHTSNTKTF